MRNFTLYLLIMLCSISAFAQNGVTFQIEELSKPQSLLGMKSYDNICRGFMAEDTNLEDEAGKAPSHFPLGIVAKSEAPDSLVSFGYNSFFNGMFNAYAQHRPFVLSPDMIWLLICQGFAQHVNAYPESMRSYLVNFSGKLSLIAQTNKELGDPEFSWEEVFPQFTEQIKENVGNELVELLTCNFSTTTPLEKIASEITIMEATKPYFEFIIMRIVCGIPEITLEGTPEDWEKVLTKARGLRKYKLDWWISELEPLLQQFVKASKGEVDKEFWCNIFKYHAPQSCGAPLLIDGWIIKFFPYNKEGKRNNLKQLTKLDNLPSEIVKVDVKYKNVYKNATIEIPLEFWSGFIGLQQNTDNFALRPQIGWLVRQKVPNNEILMSRLKADALSEGFGKGISIRVNKFPQVLLELEEIIELEIRFTDEIDIPDELAKVKITRLRLFGRINKNGMQHIKELFPHTDIKINGNRI